MVKFESIILKFNYTEETSMSYYNLKLTIVTRNKYIKSLFPFEEPFNTVKFIAKDKEELLDFICGNNWPSFLEEFFQLVIQEVNYVL